MSDEAVRIRRIALLGFLLNVLLAGAKALMAMHANSLAVTASAVDSASDGLASLAVYGGLRLSVRKTRQFPLGLYKVENVISVVVAFFVFFAGYEILTRVVHPPGSPPTVSLPLLTVLAANVAVIFLYGRYAMHVGRQTGSPTLIAEGRHRQVDVVATLVVLLVSLTAYVGLPTAVFGISLDRLAGAVVLFFIVKAGWELLSDGMRVLLDASVNPDTLLQVRGILEREPLVTRVRSLVGRSAGRFRFIQSEVELRTEDLRKAHDVIERIKAEIVEEVPHVHRVMIHFEPREPTHVRIAVPLADRSGALSERFGESPHFALVDVRLSDGSTTGRVVREPPVEKGTPRRGIRVAEWLVEQGVDRVALRDDLSGKGPGYVLRNAGISMRQVPGRDLDSAVQALLDPPADPDGTPPGGGVLSSGGPR